MTHTYDLCINGGGPIGSTLACLLAQKGLRILLLERHSFVTEPNSALDGRAYALAEGVRPLLENAGIWAALPRPAQAINTIQVLDQQTRPSRLSIRKHIKNELDFTTEDAPEGRPLGWMVEASDLLAAIGRTLPQYKNLDIRSPETGSFDFSDDNVTITLSSGEVVSVKLVIAADGRGSTLRQQAKIGLTRIPYKKDALVTVLAHEHSHNGSALEHFLPEGPFARLPLPGNTDHPHRSAIVWTDTVERIERFRSLPDTIFTQMVADRLGREPLGALTPIGKRWVYPLASQYAHRYTAQRLILIGDSAHGLHPVAGQGMNLGFRDVRTLIPLLEKAFQRNKDLGSPSLLAQYQRQTRPGNTVMLAGCDIMERLFSNQHPFLTHSRRLGLKALKHMPRLRQRFIKEAMGL